MPQVAFGTGRLHDLAGGARPSQLLEEAWRSGFRRFDTAPMYGRGRSERDLGAFLDGRLGVETVTTKVGLPPESARRVRRAVLATATAVLPRSVLDRRRDARSGGTAPARPLYSGRFAVPVVRASVEESLRRLHGRIDRLLLHEVRPQDVTPELVEALGTMVQRGDVGAVGVATQNHDTAAALEAGNGVMTVANVAVGPLHEPVTLPEHVTTRIGHGLLGGGGSHLRRLVTVLEGDAGLAERWGAATLGTEFEGSGGLAEALLSRGPHLDVTEVLVATSRPAHVGHAYELAGRQELLPDAVTQALEALVERARDRTVSSPPA